MRKCTSWLRLMVAGFGCALASLAATPPPMPTDNLVVNPGFERAFRKGEWDFFLTTSEYGAPLRDRSWRATGSFSGKLVPNNRNHAGWEAYELAISQNLDLKKYVGKPLYFGGWLRAEGGATAVIRILAVLKRGDIVMRELTNSTATAQYWEDIFDVPLAELTNLWVTVSVKGKRGAAYFDDIIVSPSYASRIEKKGQPDPGPPLTATISVDPEQVVRRVPPKVYGLNIEYIYNGHTTWNKYLQRLDDRLVDLTNGLGLTMLRFPGGVFANHYHWRDGVGPYPTRPITLVEPRAALTEHGFGTDEAWEFARRIGVEDMMVTLNANTGTPEEAGDWVRYMNNGSRRAQYWEVGNELYLRLAEADGTPKEVTPTQYADTFLAFAEKLREADPSIKIGADIEFHFPFYGCARSDANGCWTDVLLKRAAHQLDFASVHNGFAPIGLAPITGFDANWDVRTVYSTTLAFNFLFTRLMDGLAKRIDELAGEHAKRINIAATEWGPLYTYDTTDRFSDHVKTLGSALLVSVTMNAIVSHPRIESATAFKMMDETSFGWIGQRQGLWVARPALFAFQLWAKNFLPILVRSRYSGPTYDTRSIFGQPAIQNVPFLDVGTSVNDDRSEMVMIVTNRHFDRSIQTSLQLNGFYSDDFATAITLNGTELDANTGTDVPPMYAAQAEVEPDGRFSKGGPGEVWVESKQVPARGSCPTYEFPPHSVTVLKFRAKPGFQGVTDSCLVPPPPPTEPGSN